MVLRMVGDYVCGWFTRQMLAVGAWWVVAGLSALRHPILSSMVQTRRVQGVPNELNEIETRLGSNL